MSTTELYEYSRTSTSADQEELGTTRTRTITDLVDEFGAIRSTTKLLVDDITGLHHLADKHHASTLEAELNELTNSRAKDSLVDLLEDLSNLGFSWRDIAKLSNVSVPAVRKWRHGGSASSDNRFRVAQVAAFCDIAKDRYIITDVAGWLETPLHADTQICGLDLLKRGEFDLALRLARERDGDPEDVLDEFDPNWREQESTEVRVFIAEDGMPGLWLTEQDG